MAFFDFMIKLYNKLNLNINKPMKITIITVTLNSQDTIRDTLNSVLSQVYSNIEHVLVDGGSKDDTLQIIKSYPLKKKKIFIKKGYGIYKSINYGIKKATGNYIIILNSDDIFNSNFTIDNIIKIIKKNKDTNIFIGNIKYFKNFNYFKVVRDYSSNHFKVNDLKQGVMPPHPATVIKKKIYKEFGLYKENYKIAADFDIFLRFLLINNIKFKKMNFDVVRMRAGGISGKNLKSYIITTQEINNSFKENNIKSNYLNSLIRIPYKLGQLIFLNGTTYNKNFKLFKILFHQEYYNKLKFNLIRKISAIPFHKNFILSGLNLAFLGYYCKGLVNLRKDQYHWPDGIWIKKHINLKKIPGREIVRKMVLPSKISKILVLGNLSDRSLKYLKKRYKKKEVKNISLPFGNIQKIIKKKIFLSKNTLTFITLPTPKQEMLAYNLTKYNTDYKIICIGASIGISSGEEKEVPNLLKNYEFLWRLRTDFFRRISRLIESIFFYFKGKYINKKLQKNLFLTID